MSIYPSSKVLPYVYCCIHKITGKIYIGSRTSKNQKLPSHLDFPQYKTSSKVVKPIFDEFNWSIVAEFFNGQDAYDFEQQLIHEQWLVSKEMSLNGHHQYGKPSWNFIGRESHRKGKKLSEDHCKNMRKPKSPRSESHCKNLGDSQRGKPKPNLKDKPKSEEHKRKIGDFFRGKPRLDLKGKTLSNQAKRNMSKIIDVLTPDGFVIENTTLGELCSQFNLKYHSLWDNFRNNRPYKGFIKLNSEI